MPLVMDGDFEILNFEENHSVLLYDNAIIEQYPPHWHNAVEIIMPIKNTFDVVCDGKEYCLNELDIIIIPAGTLHILNACEGRRLVFLIDNAAFSRNPVLTGLSAFFNSPVVVSHEKSPSLHSKLYSTMKEIYAIYNDQNTVAYEIPVYIKFLSMMYEIMSDHFNQSKYSSTDQYADRFETIIKYIEKNYMNDISLDTLVKLSGYSKFYFSRMFSKYTGTTLPDFLNRRRITAAEMLLLDKSLSIIEIAMQTGFTSLATFNRVFKKLKGCTPTEFRKLHSPKSQHNMLTI